MRSCAVFIALVLAGATMSRAQTSIGAKGQDARTITQRDLRIASLLIQLADQARLSDDLAFAARAQAQAATLLWATDSERARAIYRLAFKSLARPGANLSLAEKQQLRSELLNQIAGRDPELAEELARSLADAAESSKESCAGDSPAGNCDQRDHALTQAVAGAASGNAQGEVERRELLISVALQVVERDPQRAMALGQLSLSSGVSQNFSRLLMLMRTVDPAMADLLFSCALARLEQSPTVQILDIHTLGAYLVASVNSPAKQTLSRAEIVKFLHLALNQIMRRAESYSIKGATRPDESAAIYFIQRQLADLFARYLPERSDQMIRKLSVINDDGARDHVIDPVSFRPSPPLEIAREAREAEDDRERDSLNARAALAWLGKGETREAQVAALKIADAQLRDRVFGQVARRYASEDRIEDAVWVARRIESDTARIDALVMLSGAALASKDRARATELLNEAEGYAIKARPAIARARSLLKIVSSFSAFDAVRGFEVMQAAVKAINEIAVPQDQGKQPSKANETKAEQVNLDELRDSAFEGTLATLARTDFERALLLAQQLDGKETSVAAQLAVCRGGLAIEPHKEQAHTEAEEIGSGAEN
ncbi:MAG TPA: hypothetical protein VJZ26_16005 [Blastocatellia bacterium]|nr:hypothetical protein [Blastocatellia bacterium]